MIVEGHTELAAELVQSIQLVKSHQSVLVPGCKEFDSWQPWEHSKITGQLPQGLYDIASCTEAIAGKRIILGSRYRAPSGFWYNQLGEIDQASGKQGSGTGLPVSLTCVKEGPQM